MAERAEACGGTMLLDTEPGKGTIVDVLLPVDASRQLA
jgi:signal transduction histidine kinase